MKIKFEVDEKDVKIITIERRDSIISKGDIRYIFNVEIGGIFIMWRLDLEYNSQENRLSWSSGWASARLYEGRFAKTAVGEKLSLLIGKALIRNKKEIIDFIKSKEWIWYNPKK